MIYIDEIQYFNKKQQQSLLEYMEDGRVTLICSTTENPYFALYPAFLSRSVCFEFKPLSAQDVLERMDKGLDSDVGEGGELLSTGEKQLFSFARAILADPKILVLDEATSSIDTLTEKKIQNAIAILIRGRTSFVIAHRLSTIVDADVILVVRDGRIIGQGTHEELMKERGYYYRLYRRQYEELVWDS